MTCKRFTFRSLALAAAGFVATALSTVNAHAYCRTVAANVPPGYDPALDGCFAPAGAFELYWKNLCVGYSLQKDASPLRNITLDQATQVAAQAFAQWSGVSCASAGVPSIQAEDLGPVECGLVQYNSSQPNQHVIVFHDQPWPYDDSSNTLGLTTLTYDATDGEIFDADMEINTHDYDLVASATVPSGSYDLVSVITHEAGHFLGLAHSSDTAAVMYAQYQAGRSSLTVDDDDGICSVYPSGGTRVTSSGPLTGGACDPTPRHGFSSACASQNGAAGGGGSAVSNRVPPTRPNGCSVGRVGGADAREDGSQLLLVVGVLICLRIGIRRTPRVAESVSSSCQIH